jgi:site-specific recombinase XerD
MKPIYIIYQTPDLQQLKTYINNLINKIYIHNPTISTFLSDARATGLRFQELYDTSFVISRTDDTLTFKTQKGSNDRTLLINLFSSYFIQLLDNSIKYYFPTSLSNFYTVVNRFEHPYKLYHDDKPLSVHALRHLYAKELFNQGKTREEIKYLLGEVNIANSDNYINSVITVKQIYY